MRAGSGPAAYKRLVTPELNKLREVLDYCNMTKVEDAYDRCLPVKQTFIQPLVLSDTAFREAWLAQAFIQKDQNDVKNFLFTFETRDHPFTIDQFVRILEARFGG